MPVANCSHSCQARHERKGSLWIHPLESVYRLLRLRDDRMKQSLGKISGVLPALVTPFSEAGALDTGRLQNLIRHVISGGVHGVFIAGSQGEFYALEDEERVELTRVTMNEANRRGVVCVGTGAITTRGAVRLTRIISELRPDALSVITPFFITPSEKELITHFRTVADNTDLPILLYNNPARTGVNISPRVVHDLASVDNIVGLKDSSGDLSLLAAFVEAGGENFSVLVGRDSLIFPALMLGASGAVASTANVVPSLVVGIFDAVQAGRFDRALVAQRRLNPLREAFELGTFPVVIKEALNMIGIPVGSTRAPIGPIVAARREELIHILQSMGVLQSVPEISLGRGKR